MPCRPIYSFGKQIGFVCRNRYYKFRGFRFEITQQGHPVALRKNSGTQRFTYPVGFWPMWKVFEKLSVTKRTAFEIDPWD